MAILWKVNIRRDNNNHNEITDAFVSSEEDAVCDCYMNATNATLIVDAVNNTVGNGIDPNAVAEMLKTLEYISQHAYDDNTGIEYILADFDNMRRLALKAIKSAELK